METPKITDWLSVVIALFAAGVSIWAIIANKKNTKIAEEALTISKESKEASIRSAVAAEKSADMSEKSMNIAEKTAEEDYRPLLQLYTKDITNTISTKDLVEIFEYDGLSAFMRIANLFTPSSNMAIYQLFVTNIGNRQCKDISVQINPFILIARPNSDIYDLLWKKNIVENKGTFTVDFLNVKQSKSLLSDTNFIAIKDRNTKLTFTITYKDLSEKPYDKIEFSTSLAALLEGIDSK